MTLICSLAGGIEMKLLMPLWQRLLITIVVMLVAGYVAGYLFQMILGFALPSYAAGLVGGLSALPVWDLLKRIRPSQGS
jgi:Na+/glutamate symporter